MLLPRKNATRLISSAKFSPTTPLNNSPAPPKQADVPAARAKFSGTAGTETLHATTITQHARWQSHPHP